MPSQTQSSPRNSGAEIIATVLLTSSLCEAILSMITTGTEQIRTSWQSSQAGFFGPVLGYSEMQKQ
jgi:hypothetical protein